VLDRYRGGHAALELQVRRRMLAGDPRDFRAVRQIDVGTFEMMILWSQPGPDGGNVELVGSLQNNLDQPVLVGVIEVPQDGKERRQDRVLPVIWLNTLDGLSNRKTESLNVPVIRPEIVGCVLDHEGAFARVRRRVRIQFMNGNGVDEMIKRAPKVVNRVTEINDQRCSGGGFKIEKMTL
jgi:hypothetical protein